jgi:hypothetical protein
VARRQPDGGIDDRPLTEYFLALPQNDKPVDMTKLQGDVDPYVIPAPVPVSVK